MRTFFKIALITICIITLLPSCSSNKKDEGYENRSFSDSYKENELNSDSNIENESKIVSDWIEIGEVSILRWNERTGGGGLEENSIVSTENYYCWYKTVGGEKIYAAISRDKILTKNTYDQIKVGNSLSGDFSEGYSYVDVSGYNYMYQFVMNGAKTVYFVNLP